MKVKEDMICPVTNKHCDDECCTVGSECNLSGEQLSEPLPPATLPKEGEQGTKWGIIDKSKEKDLEPGVQSSVLTSVASHSSGFGNPVRQRITHLIEQSIRTWEAIGNDINPEGLIDMMIEIRHLLNSEQEQQRSVASEAPNQGTEASNQKESSNQKQEEQEDMWQEAAQILFMKHNPKERIDSAIGERILNGFINDMTLLKQTFKIERR